MRREDRGDTAAAENKPSPKHLSKCSSVCRHHPNIFLFTEALSKESRRCISMVRMKGNTSCEKHRKAPISRILPAALQTPFQCISEECAEGLQHSPSQQQPQRGSKASVRDRPSSQGAAVFMTGTLRADWMCYIKRTVGS